jgi:hypothetical protein
MPHQSHRPWYVHLNILWWALQIKKSVRWVAQRLRFIDSIAATYVNLANQIRYWSRDWRRERMQINIFIYVKKNKIYNIQYSILIRKFVLQGLFVGSSKS